jgi:hypothetical protein
MHRMSSPIAAALSFAFVTACGSGPANQTVNFDPANDTDLTGPAVNLLLKPVGGDSLEVQARTTPARNVNGALEEDTIPSRPQEFNVFATATDAESGIRDIKINLSRAVCYATSSGGVSEARMASVLREQASYTNASSAPVQATIANSGLFHNTRLNGNLMMWRNANGIVSNGVGVLTKWDMEATNQAGIKVFSNVIFLRAGNTSCITTPL